VGPEEERKERRETFVASGLSARRRSGWRSRSRGEDAGNVADDRYDEGNDDDDFSRSRLSSRLSGFTEREREREKEKERERERERGGGRKTERKRKRERDFHRIVIDVGFAAATVAVDERRRAAGRGVYTAIVNQVLFRIRCS